MWENGILGEQSSFVSEFWLTEDELWGLGQIRAQCRET